MSTLQEAVGVAGQPDCQVSDTVSHNSRMPVSLLACQDSTVCDSGSESMGFSDTDNEIGSSIKQTLLNIKALNGEANSISKSKGPAQTEEETNGLTTSEKKDMVSDSNSLVVLSEEDSQQDDQDDKRSEEEEEEEEAGREIEDERMLTVGKEELSSEAPVNEDEEFRLLMDVDEEEAQDKITLNEEHGMDVGEPDRVTSPVSDNGSSQSSMQAEQDVSSKLSDSESVSSDFSQSKKHPLFIGKNVKYSFKGIMATAVKRVSNDSDSVQSLSPRPEENTKPDSSVTSAGSNSLSEATDLPADSSTMPDERNLFEKLSFLTDSGKEETDVDVDQESSSQISSSKGNKVTREESGSNEEQSEKTDPSACSVDEPMETDSPKAATNDDSSTLSAVSSTSAEPKEQLGCPEGKVTSDKDACESSQDNGTNSDPSDERSVSQTSRLPSQSLLGNSSAFCEDKAVKSQGKCDGSETGAIVKVESDQRHSRSADASGSKDSVCDIKDASKDPNLLHKLKEPKIEPSWEELPPKSGVEARCEELKTETSVKHCVESEESECSDRKRCAVEDSEHSNPKRSRLDLVIGKLGSQIGISPENIKCDESMFDSDIESGKTSSDSTENRSEEVTSEDDETVSKASCKQLTEESLEEMIKQKIKEVLEQQKEMLTKQFQEKINELQTSNEAWKSQAKELHRRAVELMSHQQRQERRRAVRVCGQRRNVGIQVGEDRINSVNQQTTSKVGVASPSRTLSQAALTNPTPISLLTSKPVPTTIAGVNQPPTNQVLVQRMPMPASTIRKDAGAPTVKSILNSNRIGQLSGPSTQPVTQAALTSQVNKTGVTKAPGSQAIGTTGQAQGIQTLVKVIDLTSDEENNSAKGGSPRSVVGQSLLGQSMFRPASSASLQPGTRILLSPGTRAPGVANQTTLTTSQPRQPGVQYQYLYTPNNQAVGTSNVVTLVSPPSGSSSTGARPAAPAPPQLTRPSQPAVSRPPQATPSVQAPPPLQSLPAKAATTTPGVAVKDKQESKEASSEGEKSMRKSPELSKHPAPLPPPPANQDSSPKKKALPPKPGLKISRVSQGIVLSWNMLTSSSHAEIASYQLFAYQETSAPVSTLLWKKVGDVKALPLPMACTLTQFQEGNKYHFAVRAVDVHGRMSAFSDPSTIHLVVQNSK
ncbi:activating transcription factor 7-interacting protein 1-like [Liolophura sinensis]|uniref:activating transcription factor 7-interacting protein 1-like n=1 Tax=Liolophura sinensis TaxID=3198878 RepID=UPI0031583D74